MKPHHSLKTRVTSAALILVYWFTAIMPLYAQNQPTNPLVAIQTKVLPIEEVTDALKEDWTPPPPVLTKQQIKRNLAKRVKSPQFELKFSKSVLIEELCTARAFNDQIIVASKNDPSEAQRKDLAKLLTAYTIGGGQFNLKNAKLLEDYITLYPVSGFTPSIRLELAQMYRKHGYFSKAINQLESFWNVTESLSEITLQRYSEKGLSRLLRLLGEMGQKEKLAKLVARTKERDLGGAAKAAYLRAQDALVFLENQPEQNVFCGFIAANEICVPLGKKPIYPDVHDEAEKKEFIANGLSLFELRAHSHEAGGDLKIVKRGKGAPVISPAIVHWKFKHYSAITKSKGTNHLLVDDGMKYNAWVGEALFNEQASGYFLVPGNTPLPAGYTTVSDEEAKKVYGRHCVHGKDDEGDDCPGGGNKDDCAMATYSFTKLNVGLYIQDTPIVYSSPFGPQVSVTLNYNQRSSKIEDLPTTANFGPRWSHGFTEYLDLEGTLEADGGNSDVHLVTGNGFYKRYYRDGSILYTTKYADRGKLVWTGVNYTITYSDGSTKVYGQGNSASPTRYYLTEIIDTFGNNLQIQYDSSLRIANLIDSLGQATTFSYSPEEGANVPTDTLKIRKITDPFGREATFKYTVQGQLFSITDPMGIVSSFQYVANDFISQLTTPYGTTSFEFEELPGYEGNNSNPNGARITSTDPYGEHERMEQNDNVPLPDEEPEPCPSNIQVDGENVSFKPKTDNLHYRNTFYWDKQQMHYHEDDYKKASLTNWAAINNSITSVPTSTKQPLEGRIYYNYTGQTNSHAPGTNANPAKVVNRVEDENGVPQWRMSQAEYNNSYGKITKTIDPYGRSTRYTYYPNEIDLHQVQVKDGATWITLVTYSQYENYLPKHIAYLSGQTVTYQYNSKGQLKETTVQKGAFSEKSQIIYDLDLDGNADEYGYPIIFKETDPIDKTQLNTVLTLTYDGVKRVRTSVDEQGYQMTLDYDNFDRATLITHPDGSTQQFVYKNLELVASKDRNSYWSRMKYDANRQLIYSQDPLGRKTQYDWCRCGDIRKLTDPKGNTTQWKRDAQGRLITKTLPDGRKYKYTYQPNSGRLSTVADPIALAVDEVTSTYSYFLDDKISKVDYTKVNTPDIFYEYDDFLGRMTKSTDQRGDTLYSYHPLSANQNGAGNIHEIDGPWQHDTIRFSYDDLGRTKRREILHDTLSGVDEILHYIETDYDHNSRPKTLDNGLGQFQFIYNAGNISSQVDAITNSAGMRTDYTYETQANSKNFRRLKSISYKANAASGGANISNYEYDYDKVGRMTSQLQQFDATPARTWNFTYSAGYELKQASLSTGDNYHYSYDKAMNRNAAYKNMAGPITQYNEANQITQAGGAGESVVEGILNELSKVKVNVNGAGLKTAQVRSIIGTNTFRFSRDAQFNAGNNTIAVEATDAQGNKTTKNYSVNIAGSLKTYEHDLNGNLTNVKDASGNILKAYTWDAKNRLHSIAEGNKLTEFEYDGSDRRIRITDKEQGVEMSNVTFLWCGESICQKRNNSADLVSRNYYSGGFIEGNAKYYYTKDHLGSIREIVAENGTTVEARYDYSPFGVVSKISGSGLESDFLYTGHYYHALSKIHLTHYRAYDAELGRWLSADPLGESEGYNLYAYVGNDPMNMVDPLGLKCEATYDRKKGTFTITDLDTGKSITEKAFSGNGSDKDNPASDYKSNRGPLPAGKYLIGEAWSGGHSAGGNNTWFKLYGPNGSGGYVYRSKPGIPVKTPSGGTVYRGEFNLHTGLASNGCITVPSYVPRGNINYPNSTAFSRIQMMLKSTSTFKYKGSNFKGTLIVK
mgnify:CR=1 FL=1